MVQRHALDVKLQALFNIELTLSYILLILSLKDHWTEYWIIGIRWWKQDPFPGLQAAVLNLFPMSLCLALFGNNIPSCSLECMAIAIKQRKSRLSTNYALKLWMVGHSLINISSNQTHTLLKPQRWDFPGGLVVHTPHSQYRGTRIGSLVWELRSHMLYSTA